MWCYVFPVCENALNVIAGIDEVINRDQPSTNKQCIQKPYLKKVTQLHQLLEMTFDPVMNEDLNSILQKAVEEVAVLHELADYMVQKMFPKAKDKQTR